MAPSLFNALRFLIFLFILSLFNQLQISTSLSPLCHSDERSALLQFKQSFVFNKSASWHPSAYPKVKSWNQQGVTRECCLWDGVECDQHTGHVIGLNLSSSHLYGSINSSSSLFQLVHLQRLSLADNDFNQSRIPLGFRHLSMLTHLDLSLSNFYGQIPQEILELTRLTSLDLTTQVYDWLRSPDLRRLVENLTSIQTLYLTNVDISSEVPNTITNLSSLRSLCLRNCGIFGLFPEEIFNLPNLQELDVSFNENLTGNLPEFQEDSPLEILQLSGTNFSSELPTSIGNLHSLTQLDIADCNFYGPLPYSLGNLTNIRILDFGDNNFQGQIPFSLGNLTNIRKLDLRNNNFQGQIPSSLANLIQLTDLDLSNCSLTGEIPPLANLSQLRTLILDSNHLTGQIPLSLGNLTQLTSLSLAENELHGYIPNSISKLVNLYTLYLSSNHLSGNVNLDNLKNLIILQMSDNNFSSLIESNENATLPKLMWLEIARCNLREFPNFLRYQDKLVSLELSGNNIHGPIPNWLWNVGRETMETLDLSFNSLTGFEKLLSIPSMSKLQVLYVQSNKLQGPVPIPPLSVVQYVISNNGLTGKIPPTLCNLPYLRSLDLSHNNLSGVIPLCLFNSKYSLFVLNVGHNSLHGTIPETFKIGSKLTMIDLSYNELQGKIPISLANQTELRFLNLGNNKIIGKFPNWLGALPNLEILSLRSNKLFGEIDRPTAASFNFSMLRIIDLSCNGFTGVLPFKYFQNWNSMSNFDKDLSSYMGDGIYLTRGTSWYYYQLSMINKGVDMKYTKILYEFAFVDLSCNKFKGNIPESIVTLNKLYSLNLSNNHLSGHIPTQLVNLTRLESLDLSSNMLTGLIPQQLVQLTSLSYFNVSHNRLVGPIPHGKQFDTFDNNSYKDNSRLCGMPLSNMCGNVPRVSTVEDDQGSDSSTYIEWKAVVIGYWSGLVVALVIAHGMWIMKMFRGR